MQFFSMLTTIGATISMMATLGSSQLTSPTGCVPSSLTPVQCTLSWIFYADAEEPQEYIRTWINTSSCEELEEGDSDTYVLGATATIPPASPGLTLPLTLTNPWTEIDGPAFTFNGTTYTVDDCTCGAGTSVGIDGPYAYACSCPFACSEFNNVAG